MTRDTTVTAARAVARSFYWSVRRELWEHRAITIAPTGIAALAVVGFLLGAGRLTNVVRALAKPAGAGGGEALMNPYAFVGVAVIATGVFVALFYAVGALYGERRDRSLLFWKSLPVSDLTTVLAKAAIPIVVVPALTFVLLVVADVMMLGIATVAVVAAGLDPRLLWAHMSPGFMWLVMAYGLPYVALSYAPIYAWLILVSAWARRGPFLWALGVPLAICLVERLALGTSHFGSMLIGAFTDGIGEAFSVNGAGEAPIHSVADIDLFRLAANPHLWIGLVVGAAFLGAAVRLRRSAEPI